MATFTKSETLGTRLTALREGAKITREQVAREIRAPHSFIRAFEEDDYGAFPARVYAEGFFKKYLACLGVSGDEQSAFLKEFRTELDVGSLAKTRDLAPLHERNAIYGYLRPFRVSVILGGILAAVFIAYIGVRLAGFLGKPELSIREPSLETVLNNPFTNLRGKVEKESHLTVNGREITIDQYGNFDTRFELAAGLNILEFLVEDRFGKMNKDVRYILVK